MADTPGFRVGSVTRLSLVLVSSRGPAGAEEAGRCGEPRAVRDDLGAHSPSGRWSGWTSMCRVGRCTSGWPAPMARRRTAPNARAPARSTIIGTASGGTSTPAAADAAPRACAPRRVPHPRRAAERRPVGHAGFEVHPPARAVGDRLAPRGGGDGGRAPARPRLGSVWASSAARSPAAWSAAAR